MSYTVLEEVSSRMILRIREEVVQFSCQTGVWIRRVHVLCGSQLIAYQEHL